MPISASGLVWIQALTMPAERGRDPPSKRLIMVDGGGRDPHARVSSDKPVYAPRDEGTVTVDVTGAGGKPAKAGSASPSRTRRCSRSPTCDRSRAPVLRDRSGLPRRAAPYQRGVGRSSSERDVPPQFDWQVGLRPELQRAPVRAPRSSRCSRRCRRLTGCSVRDPHPDPRSRVTTLGARSRTRGFGRGGSSSSLRRASRRWSSSASTASSASTSRSVGRAGVVSRGVPHRDARSLTDWFRRGARPDRADAARARGRHFFTGRHSYSSGSTPSSAAGPCSPSWDPVLLRGVSAPDPCRDRRAHVVSLRDVAPGPLFWPARWCCSWWRRAGG